MGGSVYLRNRKTTEYRSVVADSPEFYELVGQRDPEDRQPIWEQTSAADTADAKQRFERGEIKDEDIGDEGQPTGDFTAAGAGVNDTFGPDTTEPTPGERSQGAGRAAEGAAEPEGGPQPGDEGIAEEPFTDEIPGPVVARPAGAAQSGNGYTRQSKDDLEAEAERRGLSVEGTGADGNVLKDDLVSALEADDAGSSSE